ncbi:Hypothetical predicted protein [Octopus vulgaris]|uniref:Uncharacterized protein n=1 Tax=Octopus vulgaris TaxID=6645 RepID=A0AA36FBD6_OCTVU|nr:Hypothetical predicted protein [Octopus vulgaris]
MKSRVTEMKARVTEMKARVTEDLASKFLRYWFEVSSEIVFNLSEAIVDITDELQLDDKRCVAITWISDHKRNERML